MKQLKYFMQAVGFLTVIPMPNPDSFQPGDLGRAAAWYPLVGLGIGLILSVVRFLALSAFPGFLAAVLVVAAWAALTGALHLDGLADCCDGMLAAVPPERRLEIMRDPRLGTFGGAGLFLFILLKVAAVMALPEAGGFWHSALPLLLAPALARGLILLAARQPMARRGGLGAEFALGVKWHTYLAAAILPLTLILLGGLRGIIAGLLGLLVTGWVIWLARERLGGLTGDVLGLIVELSELVVLLVFAAAPAFTVGFF